MMADYQLQAEARFKLQQHGDQRMQRRSHPIFVVARELRDVRRLLVSDFIGFARIDESNPNPAAWLQATVALDERATRHPDNVP
jgi:hypothetical protein